MLYLKRGAAAQVIAAKNSTPPAQRKLFFISVDAQMPFFSGFPQTLVPGRRMRQRILTSIQQRFAHSQVSPEAGKTEVYGNSSKMA
jgi:hypothetical protein